MKLKLNVDLRGYKKGQIIKINDNDAYWLARIKDSQLDNCVEIVKEETKEDIRVKENKKSKQEDK